MLAIAHELPQACRMECHACQSDIPLAPGESLGFRDECDRCHADLHICLNCVHHDLSAYNECREPNAERLLDRDRANRCDFFRPGRGDGQAEEGSERARAKKDLENLFKKG
ncbi:MAG: hypothetical protein GY910_24740 [bacterium]|nr:hypothetical protein [bacterium]